MEINNQNFTEILNYFRTIKYNFVDNNLKLEIKNNIQSLFPNLNKEDFEVLQLFSENLIDKISNYLYFKKEEKYYRQWKQNNGRDIKGIILILLPYIDETSEMIDLNQFLYSDLSKLNIPIEIKDEDRNDLLKSKFKFSNISIGLLQYDKDNLLNLYPNNLKLIYKIIHHNYIGLLKTLEVMNGKYYINWINIIPIVLEDYKTSEIYLKTLEGLKQLTPITRNTDNVFNLLNNYYGLWFGDIYNVIKNKLYEEIKQIKFLLFGFKKDTNFYLVQYLNSIMDIDLFFTYENYEDINEDDKFKFISIVKKEEIIKIGDDITILEIWKQILLFLCNSYTNRLIVQNENSEYFKKFYFTPDIKQYDFTDEDIDDEEYSKIIRSKINEIEIDDIINFLKAIKINHIWNFLQQSMRKLQGTFLKEYLIIKKNDKTIISDAYFFPETNISFKNIYNIAKSLTHFFTPKGEWISLDSNYITFNIEEQKIFMERFLGLTNFNSWINLRKNIIREYGNINYTTKMNELIDSWDQIKLNLIFEILIKNGLLNKFEVDLELTDNKSFSTLNIGDEKKKRIGNKFKKNPKYKEAYYYLTNEKFKDLPKIRFEDSKIKKIEEYTYFELFEKDQLWFSFYAMDWLSQISFFHRYIHHRVLYVTGATGQGKSTQVPKLLLYATKAFDYKNNGKVVCTQPRIPPTKNNSERISEELGVPIVSSSLKNNFKTKTNNFYVQMKYQSDSHLKNNCPHPTLKILTDGTLYEELITNPLMKETIYKNGKKDYIYGFNNYYDIVILDESHEHNTNMDMILTLIRQSCFYNNSLRLIIMSATMSEDEPIYRSYFRCINDNLTYPIRAPLYQHPFSILRKSENDNKIVPNSIFMDRRFHISPPGETTQYVVLEKFIEESTFDKMADKPGSIKVQELSYKKILEICSGFPTGEILLFSTGAPEIKKAVEELNKILPSGNIALPYFSELNQSYKDVIDKIDKKIGTIKNKREKIHEEWGPEFIQDLSVPDGVYQRAIIIATNVAEASVTIPRLKFVVDNGYAKVNTYNNKKKLSVLQVEKISESSRVQRKGRVGRLSDGIVYFLYPKGAREKILPKYKITQEDPSNIYLKLSIDDQKLENEYVIPPSFNPNYFRDSRFYLGKAKEIRDNSFFNKNIYHILIKQYSQNNKILNKNLYWDEDNFPDLILKNESLNRSFNGQEIKTLIDENGIFYIIHPMENDIVRNIYNNIIKFNKIEIDKIPNLIFSQYLFLLQYNLVLIDPTYEFEIVDKIDFSKLIKTEMYKKVQELQKALSNNNIDLNDCLTIFSSIGLNCFNEVLGIIILIKKINFTNLESDLISLYNLYKELEGKFSDLLLFKLMKNPLEIKKYDYLVDDVINKFKKQIKNKPNDFPTIFLDQPDIWNIISKLYNSGNLENDKGKKELKFILLGKIIEQELKNNLVRIKEWCSNTLFKSEEIFNYFNELGNIILNILTIERNLDIDLNEISPLVWMDSLKSSFRNVLKTNNINERIIKSFILGRPTNYAIRINPIDKYYTLPVNQVLGDLGPKKSNQSVYIFYYNYADTKSENLVTLNIVSNLEMDYFTSCNPQIFNKYIFKNIIGKKELIVDRDHYITLNKVMHLESYSYDALVNHVNNNTKIVSPWENNNLPSLYLFFKNIRKKLIK